MQKVISVIEKLDSALSVYPAAVFIGTLVPSVKHFRVLAVGVVYLLVTFSLTFYVWAQSTSSLVAVALGIEPLLLSIANKSNLHHSAIYYFLVSSLLPFDFLLVQLVPFYYLVKCGVAYYLVAERFNGIKMFADFVVPMVEAKFKAPEVEKKTE